MNKRVMTTVLLFVAAAACSFAQQSFSPGAMTPEQVREWLAKGNDPNAAIYGSTPLALFAQMNSNPEVFKALINAGAKVNAVDSNGQTALMIAAAANPNPAVIATLLDAGADATLRNKKGFTAYAFAQHNPKMKDTPEIARLAAADAKAPAAAATAPPSFRELVQSGTAQQVQDAIAKGANVNEQWGSLTPVIAAAVSNSHFDVITTLLKAGANPRAGTDSGEDLIHIAAQRVTDVNVINAIIKTGVDLNGKDFHGWTPLFNAAFGNPNPAVLDALIAAGADPSIKAPDNCAFTLAWVNRAIIGTDVYWKLADASGMSVLDLLQAKAPPDIFALSVDHGANVNVKDSQGETPLMVVMQTDWAKARTLYPSLIKAGAQVNAQDVNGTTPLMWAIHSRCSPEGIAALLKNGAAVNVQDAHGATPLILACQDYRYNTEVVSALLDAGAHVNVADRTGTTPLMYAALADQLWMINQPGETTTNKVGSKVALLLASGADVNARNIEGKTALIFAASQDATQVESLLIKAGADPRTKDNKGLTTEDWRAKYKEARKKAAGAY